MASTVKGKATLRNTLKMKHDASQFYLNLGPNVVHLGRISLNKTQ